MSLEYNTKVKNNFKHNKNIFMVFAVSLAVFVWSFSAGTVTIALPTISQYMDINTYMASWVVVIHLLVLTSFLLIFGRLGDLIGLKKVFLAGILIFTFSSYLCGISLDFVSLLCFRALQGLGSAMLLSIAPALISQHLDINSQAKGFAAISAATTLALAAGYGAGGLTLEFFDWNWIFLIVVPLGIISLISGIYFIPRDIPTAKKLDFDLVGAFFVLIAMMVLILSIYDAKDKGLASSWFMGGFLFSIVLFIALWRWERKQKYPIFDLNLLKNNLIFFPLLAAFLITLVFMGTIFLVPFYLDLVMGYSPAFSGMLILFPTLLVILASPLSGLITDKFGSRIPTLVACLFLIVAMGVFIFINPKVGVFLILVALGARFLSEGFFSPANTKQIMKNGILENKGSLSSMMNTAKYMGIIMGVVLFDAIFESTIVQKTANLSGIPVNGAVQLAAPIPILLMAFQNAFFLGLIISIVILIMVLLSRQWN